jgi:hypothetical protein
MVCLFADFGFLVYLCYPRTFRTVLKLAAISLGLSFPAMLLEVILYRVMAREDFMARPHIDVIVSLLGLLGVPSQNVIAMHSAKKAA